MNMDDFAAKVCAAVEEKLGEGVRTEIREVTKNNNIRLHGLLILTPGRTVVPTIYLERFLEAYESGAPFEKVVCGLLDVYRRNLPEDDIDMDFFRSFEAVKERICYRLVGRRGNEDLLGKIPHVDFLDMAICFYYVYRGKTPGDGTILIYGSHVEMWDTCTEELLRLAGENTPRIFPWECCGIKEILGMPEETDGNAGAFSLEEEKEAGCPEIPIKVLGNHERLYGAACILYPGVLEEIAREMGDFYIIPSSVHETLLLKDTGNGSAADLQLMICEVNNTQVAPEEVLTNTLYRYDSAEKKVAVAWGIPGAIAP